MEWAVGFFFGNTELSLELRNIIAGISGFDDSGANMKLAALLAVLIVLIIVGCSSGTPATAISEKDLPQSDIHFNKGVTYAKDGEYAKAVNEYTKTIELAPNDAGAYYNRGNSYDNLGLYQDAIADYTKAIRSAPDYALAYNNRGWSYHNMGDDQAAIVDYNKAIQIDSGNALIYLNRSVSTASWATLNKPTLTKRKLAR